MKEIIRKIGDILYNVPNMSRDCMGSIMNPCDNEERALRLLNFLEENKNNKEIMRVSYLLRHNHEIIGN